MLVWQLGARNPYHLQMSKSLLWRIGELGKELARGLRQAGDYLDRILNGEKPATLPVMQVTKMDLVINMKTAKGLGLTIAPTLPERSDEVFE